MELMIALGKDPNFEPLFTARADHGIAALYRLR